MFGTTRFPFNFANRRGIPMIESSAVTADTDNLIITLPNRVFRWLNDKGVILFRLNQTIPAGSDALPALFSSNDFTQAITLVDGTEATGASFPGTGVYLLFYDKDANIMQILTN